MSGLGQLSVDMLEIRFIKMILGFQAQQGQLAAGYYSTWVCSTLGFSGGAVVKSLPASAGDTGDDGSIPGSGRSPGEGMATHSGILA